MFEIGGVLCCETNYGAVNPEMCLAFDGLGRAD